jgi:hypothetical protein
MAAEDQRRRRVRAAETRLLYENATTGVVASILIAVPLAYAQRGVTPTLVISVWLAVLVAVAVTRYLIARRYWRASPDDDSSGRWLGLFVASTALAGATWVVAAMVFYDPAQPTNEMFLMFVLGGVMLGGSSLLAARPEAFLIFLVPIGLLTAIRLAAVSGEEHLLMAFLSSSSVRRRSSPPGASIGPLRPRSSCDSTTSISSRVSAPRRITRMHSIAIWSCASANGRPC